MIGYLAAAAATAAALRGMWSPCGLSMLSALNPLAERSRGHRFGVTAGWYVLGAVLGGTVTGAVAALLAALVRWSAPSATILLTVSTVAAAVAWLSDAQITRWQLPVFPRQVNEQWIGTYRRWIYAGGFGVQIGTGFATYIMSGTVYLMVVLAALTASPAAALAIGTGFGLLRGLQILIAARAGRPGQLGSLLLWIESRAAASLHLSCAASAVITAVGAGVLSVAVSGNAAAGLAVGAAVAAAGIALDRYAATHLSGSIQPETGTSPG